MVLGNPPSPRGGAYASVCLLPNPLVFGPTVLGLAELPELSYEGSQIVLSIMRFIEALLRLVRVLPAEGFYLGARLDLQKGLR